MGFDNEPFFSVIIPTLKRPSRRLQNCLEALAGQSFRSFEIIVVDDGSDFPPGEIVGNFADRLDVQLVLNNRLGPASARNLGAKMAKGKMLAFTDDDCEPAPDWLQKMADSIVITKESNIALGGRTVNVMNNNLFSIASQCLISYLYSYFQNRPGRFFTTNNIVLPVKLFGEIGGFDYRIPFAAEDRDLFDRWQYMGYGMQYIQEAVVYHKHSFTLFSYLKQHMAYGQGAFFYHRLRSGRKHLPINIDQKKFYLGMMRFPFSHFRNIKATLIVLLLVISQVAYAIGYFFEWGRKPLHK